MNELDECIDYLMELISIGERMDDGCMSEGFDGFIGRIAEIFDGRMNKVFALLVDTLMSELFGICVDEWMSWFMKWSVCE